MDKIIVRVPPINAQVCISCHMHRRLKGYTAFWQSASLGCRKKVAKMLINRQRTPEKRKEPPTPWNWGPKDSYM